MRRLSILSAVVLLLALATPVSGEEVAEARWSRDEFARGTAWAEIYYDTTTRRLTRLVYSNTSTGTLVGSIVNSQSGAAPREFTAGPGQSGEQAFPGGNNFRLEPRTDPETGEVSLTWGPLQVRFSFVPG